MIHPSYAILRRTVFRTLFTNCSPAETTAPAEVRRLPGNKLHIVYTYAAAPAAMEITELPGSGTVHWNGATVATIRSPHDSNSRTVPAIIPLPAPVPPSAGKNILELHLDHVPSPLHAGVILHTGNFDELHRAHANRRLLDGAILGTLVLAGTFNMLLLLANPRNVSHLWFSALTLLAAGLHARRQHLFEATAVEFIAPERLAAWYFAADTWTIAVALPVLLFSFFYVLFPGLGNYAGPRIKPGSLYTRRMRTLLWIICGCALVLSTLMLLAPAAVYAPYLGLLFYGYSVPLMLLAAIPVLLALRKKYRASLLAAVGGTGTAAGLLLDYGFLLEGRTPLYASTGAMVLVFAMVVLMGPQRYEMHRQLKTSRHTLRDTNKKLVIADRQKNRYILGSAREMIAPLQDMLAHCLDIVGDPAYKLHSTQLAVLSRMMDTARLMLRRFQRIQLNFGGRDGEGRTTNFQAVDAAFFLNSQAIVFEERHPQLRIDVRVPDDLHRLHADPELLEICLAELIDNVAAHGRGGRVTLETGRRGHGRAALCVYEREAAIGAEAAVDLIEEFRTGVVDTERVGLGFSLVRRIAEIHGSDFSIRRAEDEDGLRYEFTVPLVMTETPEQMPGDVNALRHVQFLSEIGFDRQARKEAQALVKREPAMKVMVDGVWKR